MTCPPCTKDCNEGRNCPARIKDEIIEMAQECGLIGMRPHLDGIYAESLEAFAKLVAAKERKSCAEIVGQKKYSHIPRKNQLWLLLLEISDEIRARGQA